MPETEVKLKPGDIVRKIKGYGWPGVVAAVYPVPCGPDAGCLRVVVCSTVPEIEGAQHIFNPEQLEVVTDV